MPSILQDTRCCFRTLRNQPVLTLVCVATLAIAVGAAACILSVVERILINPVPYRQANQIYVFEIRDLTSPRPGRPWLTELEFLEYRDQVDDFAEVIAVISQRDVVYAAPAGHELLSGAEVSGHAFAFLGVQPALGRELTPGDTEPGALEVFVMSHKMWVQHGSDPTIVGRTFDLNGTPTVLVGVMPPRFALFDADLWLPTVLTPATPRPRYCYMFARLKPGVQPRHAQTEIALVANRLAGTYPELYPRSRAVSLQALPERLVGRFRPVLYLFTAAIMILLTMACGNVTSMLLARAGARENEMAIRTALGATRSALFRLQLIESLMLALLGAGAGCFLAYAGLNVFVTVVPPGLVPAETALDMNWHVVAIAVGLAVVSAGLIGVLPLLVGRRADLAAALRNSVKGASASLRGTVSRRVLIGEVALAMVLCSSAGLLVRTVMNLQSMDLGANPENVLYVRLRFPAPYTTATSRQQLLARLFSRVRNIPGVVAVAAASALPLEGGIMTGVDVAGRPHESSGNTLIQLCTEEYVRVARLRLIHGRFLSRDDVDQVRRVAVVNDAFAKSYFGRDAPIGEPIRLNVLAGLASGRVDDPVFNIVGVVANEKNHGIRNPPLPQAYIPSASTPAFSRSVLVRTAHLPVAFLANIRTEIAAIEPRLVMIEAGSLTEFLRKYSYAEPRFAMAVMMVFACVALILAALGVYGVTAYTVALQRREIGIRMALGASRADVLQLVIVKALRVIAIGLGIGIPTALLTTRLLATQLWGIAPNDPGTFAVVSLLMIVTGLAASFFPARSATAVSPQSVLTSE